ncbi:hypothetical protein ACMFMF_011675 [Clarireedia jacksonii]
MAPNNENRGQDPAQQDAGQDLHQTEGGVAYPRLSPRPIPDAAATSDDQSMATRYLEIKTRQCESLKIWDHDMWCVFQEDFIDFDERSFKKAGIIACVNLRNVLRSHGVNIRATEATKCALELANAVQVWTEWTPDEIVQAMTDPNFVFKSKSPQYMLQRLRERGLLSNASRSPKSIYKQAGSAAETIERDQEEQKAEPQSPRNAQPQNTGYEQQMPAYTSSDARSGLQQRPQRSLPSKGDYGNGYTPLGPWARNEEVTIQKIRAVESLLFIDKESLLLDAADTELGIADIDDESSIADAETGFGIDDSEERYISVFFQRHADVNEL